MNVRCNDCGHTGPAKTNSRDQTRCAACYSLDVTAIAEPAAVPAVPAETPPAPEPIGEADIKRKPRATRRGA